MQIFQHYCFVIFSHFSIDLFPQAMEGCRLIVNKGLSNHFQVNHNLQLSGIGPGAYHFGATYVGTKQTGPNEVQRFLSMINQKTF